MSKKKRKKKSKKGARSNVPRSSPKKRAGRVQHKPKSIGHTYRNRQQAGEWLVPFRNDRACVYHGHEDSDNHDLCGPQVFCCANSAQLLADLYPSWNDPKIDWQLTPGSHLVTWIPDAGIGIFYFFVCAPDDPNTLLFVGIKSSEARNVLLKRVPLDHYLDEAGIVN
ncbi:MAG: hypothetical protein ACPGWR_31770 [Ardenticatenaceae bacterium]